jgi:hypothetical protein
MLPRRGRRLREAALPGSGGKLLDRAEPPEIRKSHSELVESRDILVKEPVS